MTSLVVGDLSLELRRSERRRSPEITVERDGRLTLAAPAAASAEELTRFVQSKRFRIYQQLAARESLPPTPPPRQFVDGAGFPYLGRSYRLLLVPEQEVPVKLTAGRFQMRRADAERGKGGEAGEAGEGEAGEAGEGEAHMIRWYSAHARPWLAARVARYAGRIRVTPAGLTVRDLGYRWGSCGKGGRLYFHWKTILLPPRLIEYVVVHELVHLREPDHGAMFWRRVERV
ncbi:MAG TPA: SprT family zinc-dependent metalloprotease, partial [Candidatus Nanopelagicales bacterium]|nr:SprT family zinc-dependent metalloprotease [Candidatus Nanopelagicales bacterium]